ncbi:NTP transferase domain-containing protein [Porphyrobacter sp. LM 6]|uniref:NTP transferase domain-containing protein n=1 Tax=Porphyrobacter sp. LM 6 TaxID=1896196 RepID=UPI000847878E|nr:NTP transferase domain-containing protein [Porphyrobacter sp. LM 6]AOL95263.1 MobA-like NTP transferase domain-containing protein [Porphyrobacter sp. LM 6]
MTNVPPGWTALVLAGQRPGVDRLAAHFGREAKALIPVAGTPMLGRVLRALADTPEIARIIVLAQDAPALLADPALAWTTADPRIIARVSGRTISGSVLDAVNDPAVGLPVLVTTADNVMLTPATIREFIAGTGASDVSVALVERGRLEAAVGPNRRTWLTFRDGAFTGANLFALTGPAAANALKFWERVEQDRKSVFRLAAHFGPVLMVKLLLKRMSVRAALAAAGAKLGAGVAPVLLSDGRMGVDVDKPEDHTLAERLLAERG